MPSSTDNKPDGAPNAPVDHPPALIAPGRSNVNVLRVVEPSWIEIELVGEDDGPIPFESYLVHLPDGNCRQGKLDENGLAHLYVPCSGTCVVIFPHLDKDALEQL